GDRNEILQPGRTSPPLGQAQAADSPLGARRAYPHNARSGTPSRQGIGRRNSAAQARREAKECRAEKSAKIISVFFVSSVDNVNADCYIRGMTRTIDSRDTTKHERVRRC